MRLPDPARALAVTAAAAGATLLGASLGGMASVDGQLRAVAPAPLRVVEGPRSSTARRSAARGRRAATTSTST